MKDPHIRLPENLIEYLDSRAKKNNRSRAAEMRQILSDLQGQEGPSPTIMSRNPYSEEFIEVPNPAYSEWLKRQKGGRK